MASYLKILKIVFVLVTFTNAADIKNSFRIIGGYRPKEHTLAKYIVSIRLKDYEVVFGYGVDHQCGGSIIAPKIILTAANCFRIPNDEGIEVIVEATDIYVIAGTPHRLTRGLEEQRILVAEIINHEDFVHTPFKNKNDIALVRLVEDIIEDGIKAQRIPIPTERMVIGTACTALGWGRLFEDGPTPDELAYVNLYILSNTNCRRLFDTDIWAHVLNMHSFTIRKTTFCAVDLSDDSVYEGFCKGDIGGPLICNGEVVGIASSSSCGRDMSVFTNVYHYRDWIESHANL